MNTVRLTDGGIEILVSVDAGPRITHYARAGGENVLSVSTSHPYAGHRLWVAPESRDVTYARDAHPVDYVVHNAGHATFRAPADTAHIVKEMQVGIDGDSNSVVIVHRITNAGKLPIQAAPWALTVMRGGGTAILPQEPFRAHTDDFLPVRALALWGYTDLSDPRWSLDSRFIRLRCDARHPAPQKIGALNKRGWCGYHVNGQLFVKQFAFDAHATYPDYGVNNELFTAGDFIEIESLGALAVLEPGASCTHEERWYLHAAGVGDLTVESFAPLS